MSPPTVLVIPAYCEAGRVGDVVRAARAHHPELTVMVVDDGSPDGTAMEAEAAGARVLRHPFNLGYGAALHSGYCAALRGGFERRMSRRGGDERHRLADMVHTLGGEHGPVVGDELHDVSAQVGRGHHDRLGVAQFGQFPPTGGTGIIPSRTGF